MYAVCLAHHYKPGIGSVFFVQMLSIGLIYSLGAVVLFKHIFGLPWKTNERGIGSRRALSFSGTVMFSTILRMVMFKYSEVFFIAAIGGTTLAGIYDLGYTIPYTAVTFLPLALLPLFTSGLCRGLCARPTLFGQINQFLLQATDVGFASRWNSGRFFCAASLSRALFRRHGRSGRSGFRPSAWSCCFLSFPCHYLAAIKAKEKVLNMVPMLVLQISVNLTLDWLLIVLFQIGRLGGALVRWLEHLC